MRIDGHIDSLLSGISEEFISKDLLGGYQTCLTFALRTLISMCVFSLLLLLLEFTVSKWKKKFTTHPWQVRRYSGRDSPRSDYVDEVAVSSGIPIFLWAFARALPVRSRCPVAFADRPGSPCLIICTTEIAEIVVCV